MELSIPAVADRARARRKATYVPDDPLLTAAEAAAERGQALSTFWRDVRAWPRAASLLRVAEVPTVAPIGIA